MEAAGRVQVYARVRPAASQEVGFASAVEVGSDGRAVRLRNDSDIVDRVLLGQAADAAVSSTEAKEFVFDGVFPPDSTQREVFMQIGLPVLKECMKGFNGTILAYGQTGSGKTHSLLHQGQKAEDAGLLPRLVASLFVQIVQDVAHVYEVEAAAVQVYNEQIDDLLHPEHQTGGGQNLPVQQGGVVPGLTWVKCLRPDAMLDAFTRARANVVYAETKMNKASSRSHAVFQIKITKRQRVTSTTDCRAQRMQCIHGRLNVVDLAGSERVKKSGVEGAQFKEATAINKSLLAFGNVVSALAAKKSHVPLRDSKLTRILDGSIGGNCKTSLLVCASPSMESASETLNTFEFASRAMRVEVDARVNTSVVEVSAKALLADLASDAEQLGCIPLGPELEALRRQSQEAADRARTEAEQRDKAIALAEGAARQSQAAARDAEQRAKQLREEADTLRVSFQKAESEAQRLRKAVGTAETSAKEWKSSSEAMAQEAKKLRDSLEKAERAANEWRAAAEKRASEVAELRQEEARQVSLEVEERGKAQQEAAQALERALLAEREAADWRERATSARTSAEALQQEVARASEEGKKIAAALETAQDEVASLRQQGTEAAEHATALKAEVAALAEELRQREALLDEASARLERFRLETDEREARLKREFQAELDAQQKRYEAQIAQLEATLMQVRQDARATQEEERQRHADEMATVEVMLEHKVALWHDERAQLEAQHQAALESQMKEFQAQLAAGREEFQAKLAELERQFSAQRHELLQQLDEQREELERSEAKWKLGKDNAVREVCLNSSLQQKRLAAAFKAARCVAAAKEAQLREAHEELERRFAARESRQEDMQMLAEQRKSLEEHRRGLLMRDRQLEELCRELNNRDANDKIFGAPELRFGRVFGSPCRKGSVPPLPGKKLGELQAFAERDQRRRSFSRQHCSSDSSSPSTTSRVLMTAQQLSVR